MKPVVKWAGGKTQLINEIKSRLPQKFNNYYEPFVGGGAVFLNLENKKTTISDTNYELISMYECISQIDCLNKMMRTLDSFENQHNDDFYYSTREIDRTIDFKDMDKHFIGARFIYLNKAGFNGIYRVNSKGYFNVPSNKKIKIKTYDKENLLMIHTYLSDNVKILNKSYEISLINAKKGDFVYFNPPYDKINTNSFTKYQKDDFTLEDQIKLSNVFIELTNRGVNCLMSNHNTELIRELYKDFHIDVVLAKRQINSDKNNRGNVEEVLIRNYSL